MIMEKEKFDHLMAEFYNFCQPLLTTPGNGEFTEKYYEFAADTASKMCFDAEQDGKIGSTLVMLWGVETINYLAFVDAARTLTKDVENATSLWQVKDLCENANMRFEAADPTVARQMKKLTADLLRQCRLPKEEGKEENEDEHDESIDEPRLVNNA